MDSETKQYIERVLKKDERVKYVFFLNAYTKKYIEIDYEKSGKKGSCILAFVKNLAEAHQYGIFFVQTSIIFNYTIEKVFPFTKEILYFA